jgi:hypothetical protein
MREFAAMVPVGGRLVEIRFDALDERDALSVAVACHGGLVPDGAVPSGGAAVPGWRLPSGRSAPEPVAFDITRAREILGGISRATVYAWLALGRLERVPGTRRVLITRSSLERAVTQT